MKKYFKFGVGFFLLALSVPFLTFAYTATQDLTARNTDTDADGIYGANDKCPDTAPDTFSKWRPKEFFSWDGTAWQGYGASSTVYTIEYTYGCSGTQIIANIEKERGKRVTRSTKQFGVSQEQLAAWRNGAYTGTSKKKVEKLTLQADDEDGVTTRRVYEQGKIYTIRVRGTWSNRPGEVVDAQYTSMDNWKRHQFSAWTHSDWPQLLDLQVNDTEIDWGPYNKQHVYTATFVPQTTGPLTIRVFDSVHDDNRGAFTIEVFSDRVTPLW